MEEILERQLRTLARRNRLLMFANVLLLAVIAGGFLAGHLGRNVARAQTNEQQKSITVSEVKIVDENGIVRARLGVHLPDAVVDGKVHHRGDDTAGMLLYDSNGEERSGYVTFSSSGNVGLTLDNRSGQTAEFLAGPDAGSVMRLHWHDDAVELRTDEDGPSLHIMSNRHVLYHEPPVEHPESTALCKALRGMRPKMSEAQLMDACTSRSSEAACHACLGK
jgi:hypothetical protein